MIKTKYMIVIVIITLAMTTTVASADTFKLLEDSNISARVVDVTYTYDDPREPVALIHIETNCTEYIIDWYYCGGHIEISTYKSLEKTDIFIDFTYLELDDIDTNFTNSSVSVNLVMYLWNYTQMLEDGCDIDDYFPFVLIIPLEFQVLYEYDYVYIEPDPTTDTYPNWLTEPVNPVLGILIIMAFPVGMLLYVILKGWSDSRYRTVESLNYYLLDRLEKNNRRREEEERRRIAELKKRFHRYEEYYDRLVADCRELRDIRKRQEELRQSIQQSPDSKDTKYALLELLEIAENVKKMKPEKRQACAKLARLRKIALEYDIKIPEELEHG